MPEATEPSSGSAPRRRPHPFVYLLLFLPFGASSGFVTVTLAYQLTQSGVDAAQVAFVVAMDLFPQQIKFLWAPFADTTLTRKRWYLIGAGLTGAGILGCGLVPLTPALLPVLWLLVLLMSLATTFLAMSVEALIAYNTPNEQKGRASGWFQAGNLGGSGLGGGAALWMAEHLSAHWISATALGLACALCAGLVWIEEPHDMHHAGPASGPEWKRQWERLLTVLKEVWQLVRSRRGFLALLVVFLPLATGAASNLWAAVAEGWHAGADTVALVNGALTGVVQAFGCLVGGYVCDRLDRKNAYLLFGAAQALCMLGMALAPHTETMFVGFTMLYAALNGLGYAAFSAVVLEAIGARAAATQYNVYASLSNIPISYMGMLEGWTYTNHGASAMLYLEAGMAALAIAVFAAAATRRPPSPV
jgi:MFS transporter, PAT family, beta-lactamase induction signal transducer AmpG